MNKKRFNDAYRKYNQKVFMTAYGITGNYDDSMDIMQDTFIRYSKVTDEVQNEGAYISMIARNLSLNYIKRESRKTELFYDIETKQPGPHDEAENRQRLEKLEIALSRLSEQERRVFALKFYSGSSYADIADMLEITESTARVLFKRAVDKLKENVNV